jgi:hypothetical protein
MTIVLAGTSSGSTSSTAQGSYFNVKDYGAVGDGSTDDSSAIDATCDAAILTGGTVYFPPGRYYIKTPFYSEIGSYDVKFSGDGATLFCKYEDHPDTEASDLSVFYPWVSYTDILTPSSITKDSTTITVPSTTALSVGYGVRIDSSSEAYSGTYLKGYHTMIVGILSATTFRVSDPAPYAITTNPRVIYYAKTPRIVMEGLTLEWTGTPDTVTPTYQRNGYGSEGTFGLTVRDVTVKNYTGFGIATRRQYGTLIENCDVSAYRRTSDGLGSNIGYGISLFDASDSIVRGCHVSSSHHALELSGLPANNVLIKDCFLDTDHVDDGRSLNTHIHHYVVVDNCILPQAAKYGGGTIIFRNCRIENNAEVYPLMNRGTCTFNTLTSIENCDITVKYNIAGGGCYGWVGAGFTDFGDLTIKDNRIVMETSVVYFFNATSSCTSYGALTITNNEITCASASTFFGGVVQSEIVASTGTSVINQNRLTDISVDSVPAHGGGTKAFVFDIPVLATGAGNDADDIITVLQALGIVKQS